MEKNAEFGPAAKPEVSGPLVDKIVERCRKGVQPINGTARTIETLLRFGDFQCYPTMFPRVYPNGDVFYPCEAAAQGRGQFAAGWFAEEDFRAVGRRFMGIFRRAKGFATCSEKRAFTLFT